jgi:hypothetical protein
MNLPPLLENRAFVPGPFFWLVSCIFGPSTNNYICTRWSHWPVQPLTGVRRCHLPPHPVQMPHICIGWWLRLVKCEANTFVSFGATARYKCEHICTGPCGGPVQMCNDYFSFSPPPHSSSSSLQLEVGVLPDLPLVSFCMTRSKVFVFNSLY